MDAVHSTRPPIDCKSILPQRAFAALPHDIEGDPRLSPADKALLLALLFWARSKAHCWPSDATIGKRIGRSAATVQRRLRTLETLGLIVREKTAANRTGRVIRLAWRTAPPAVSDRPHQSPVTDPPRAPVRDKEDVALNKKHPREFPGPNLAQRNGSKPEHRPEPAPVVAPAPSELPAAPKPLEPSTVPPGHAQALAWLSSGDPILRAEAERRLRPRPAPRPEPATLAEVLERIHDSPGRVPDAAELLSQAFDDRKSWSGFHAVCRRCFEGELPPAVLVDALNRANRPGVRNRGALFMTVVGLKNR